MQFSFPLREIVVRPGVPGHRFFSRQRSVVCLSINKVALENILVPWDNRHALPWTQSLHAPQHTNLLQLYLGAFLLGVGEMLHRTARGLGIVLGTSPLGVGFGPRGVFGMDRVQLLGELKGRARTANFLLFGGAIGFFFSAVHLRQIGCVSTSL